MDDSDHLRFIHNLFAFNDSDRVNNNFFHASASKKTNDIRCRYLNNKVRKLLVNIHAFCLMPNHYHLILSPRVEGGISKFIHKINMGYAKHFNEKYERSGSLFQGKFKRIPIKSDAHFIHLPYYVHLNPLDIFAPEWRERRISNLKQVIRKLETYRWSSHLDYLGEKNFPSVINKSFLLEFFGGEKEYGKSIYGWLEDLEITEDLKFIMLED